MWVGLDRDQDVVGSSHHEVPAQKALQEAAFAAAPGPKHVAEEDVALGLFLLQVDAFVTCDCGYGGGRGGMSPEALV